MQVNSELGNWAKGHIRGYFRDPLTGEEAGHFEQDNVITYQAADIMARMLGNDTNYVPRYMGFIYGQLASPSLVDPDTLPAATRRIHTWASIGAELADPGVVGNVLVSPLSSNPSISVNGDSSLYTGNAVELVAQSGNRLEYGYPTGGSTYAAALQDDGSDYMYQALILTRLVDGTTISYMPFARVSLKIAGSYPQKPAGWELALFWQITYM